ncbi:MAG: hypothetical protein J6X49_12825 [Victivallales bacterium]|nr:hypothetical protein [Victivallales bacterium]
MNKKDTIENRLWSVAVHESGHIVALLSYHITPYYVEINDSGGCTKCDYPNDWTMDKDDYVLLSGCVAESMSNGTFADVVEQVIAGEIPQGASSDFSKLKMTDTQLIADTMLYIRDYFCNERWSIVMEFATELLLHGELNKKAISAIADRLCGIEHDIGRIARLMQRRKFFTYDELQNEEPI